MQCDVLKYLIVQKIIAQNIDFTVQRDKKNHLR